MEAHRRSYWKTTIGAFLGAAAFSAIAYGLARFSLPIDLRRLLTFVEVFSESGLLITGASGILVLVRDGLSAAGEEDLFLAANSAKKESSLTSPARRSPLEGSALRLFRRLLGARRLLVGDAVRIRSLEDIAATLDDKGRLDGLPFTPEMARLSGAVAHIYRSVDKVYDYGHSKKLRRLRDTFSLVGVRCDGAFHDGCQAQCLLLWKSAWLERVDADAPPREAVIDRGPARHAPAKDRAGRYVCQYTELRASSQPIPRFDIRADIRPLLAGNVTARAFLVAVCTRLFNRIQRLRGGASYPALQAGRSPHAQSAVRQTSQLPAAGDFVRVKPLPEIVRTLGPDAKLAGLWYDKDMARHCSRRYRVARWVERIIDDATGRMVRFRSPAAVLENVESSGEFLRFCAQHELPFWRAEWLQPDSTPPLGSSPERGGDLSRSDVCQPRARREAPEPAGAVDPSATPP